jgi:4-amino-4-deoxy-L-arabinose transferase-like glycosyltransferase
VSSLLLPRTDLGVLAQAVVLGVVLALSVWATRRRSEFRLLALGTGLMLFALMGLRAAH